MRGAHTAAMNMVADARLSAIGYFHISHAVAATFAGGMKPPAKVYDGR